MLDVNPNTLIRRSLVIGLSAVFLNIGVSHADDSISNSTVVDMQKIAYGKKSMVVTNNPWASKAAEQILKDGGSAADASIAAVLVLSLTEPQSSGIGGGGYALSYHNNKLKAYDGREVAPKSATPELFLDKNGQPMDFRSAWLSPVSAGIPGEIAMLYKLHQDSGKLAWKKLFEPAIKLANDGFPMSPLLSKELHDEQAVLVNNPDVKKVYFTSDGQVKPIGSIVTNPEFAKTLKLIANNPQEFYTGKIAKDIVTTVNNSSGYEYYTLSDLKGYEALIKDPICSKYRDKYNICSVPPSTAGGVTSQEIMQLFANKYSESNSKDPLWVYTFLEASKLAYADRNQYLADPDFVKQPVDGILDPEYLANRSKLITDKALVTPVAAGTPKGIDPRYAPDTSPKPHGTTSMSIVDKDGNTMSMTVTIESPFGNHLFVDGFFLNNELTDFSFAPKTSTGQLIANRVEAGKRPRSSISPTIVFDNNDKVYAVAGSPGGSHIICTVARNLILMLDLQQDPYQAAAYPSFCAMNNNPTIEQGDSLVENMVPQLESMGEVVKRSAIFSGEANILRVNNQWVGGSDPRREGIAIGN